MAVTLMLFAQPTGQEILLLKRKPVPVTGPRG